MDMKMKEFRAKIKSTKNIKEYENNENKTTVMFEDSQKKKQIN